MLDANSQVLSVTAEDLSFLRVVMVLVCPGVYCTIL